MLPHLSLVIPAYNEEGRLPACIRALVEFGAGLQFSHEVLIVVEPGRDATPTVARELSAPYPAIRVIENDLQRGKGYAVRRGMLEARGVHIVYMDADLSVPVETVHAFLAHFDAHPELDVLIGNRQHARSRIRRRQSFFRRTMGGIFNRVVRGLALSDFEDTQCGFKAFRRAAGQAIFAQQEIDGFAFDIEVLLLAKRLGCEVADLPVEWINSPESHVHIFRDSLAMLRDAAQLSWRFRRRSGGPIK